MAAVSQRVAEVEAAAEDVLTCKQQIVDLDAKRNSNREALNALRPLLENHDKVKVCFGTMFIRLPGARARALVEKDQQQLDQEINQLHQDLKAKVQRLHQLQGIGRLLQRSRQQKTSRTSSGDIEEMSSNMGKNIVPVKWRFTILSGSKGTQYSGTSADWIQIHTVDEFQQSSWWSQENLSCEGPTCPRCPPKSCEPSAAS